jgi:hypothetical protein
MSLSPRHRPDTRQDVRLSGSLCCCIPTHTLLWLLAAVAAFAVGMCSTAEGRHTLHAATYALAHTLRTTLHTRHHTDTRRPAAQMPRDTKAGSGIRRRSAVEMPEHVYNFNSLAHMTRFTRESRELIERMRQFMEDNGETCLPMYAYLDRRDPHTVFNFMLLSKRPRPFAEKLMLEHNMDAQSTVQVGARWSALARRNSTSTPFGIFGGVFGDPTQPEPEEPALWTIALFNVEVIGGSHRKIKTIEHSFLCEPERATEHVRNETVWIRYDALVGDWAASPAAYTIDLMLDGEEGACVQKVWDEMTKPHEASSLCTTQQ